MIRNENLYRSLVVAGLGSIGQALLTLKGDWFGTFETVVGVDCDEDACQCAESHGITIERGDICEGAFLVGLIESLPSPILLVNCCAGIDTVQLRENLQDTPVGYIDICESQMSGNDEYRFSVGMPYTNRPCHGAYPHWLCQGINPGLVELIARKLMRQLSPAEDGFSVTIFENDQLSVGSRSGEVAVGWCPEDLIEEVMVSPSLKYQNGAMIEGAAAGTPAVMACWQGVPTPARLAGHEDVWNLGQLQEVSDARFVYALHPRVMDVFETTPQKAAEMLKLPVSNQTLHGLERIVVTVKHCGTGQHKSLLWESDHALSQQRCGINAVQYQTASSLLLSILMIQQTPLGQQVGTWNASTLPLADADWRRLDTFMKKLGIFWQSVPRGYVSCMDETAAMQAANSCEGRLAP